MINGQIYRYLLFEIILTQWSSRAFNYRSHPLKNWCLQTGWVTWSPRIPVICEDITLQIVGVTTTN
jgi:hypothetical protein